MARFILFLTLLVPVAIGGHWLLEHPGDIQVQWLGYDIRMHTALAGLAIALLCVLTALLVLFGWQIVTWPERRRARRQYRTMSKGLRQLTHGVTYLALGDEKAAAVALKKAQAALPDEPLPQLLTAQLLQRQGKNDEARGHLRALLKHEATAVLASRRLIEQHMARGEWPQALALAEQLREDAPKDRWLALALIDLAARADDFERVLALTEGWQWQSPLTKEERHRYAALGYLMKAEHAETQRAKLTALRHATGYAPEFLPATIAYAELLTQSGDVQRARKLLRHAWMTQASTALIGPILNTLGDLSPRKRARVLRAFTQRGALVPSLLLEAQDAYETGELAQAETLLNQALAQEESRPVLSRMADVAKRLHGEESANRWLARAMDAPAGEQWVCQRCGSLHATWLAHCQQCHAFDTLRYERPELRITSVEMQRA